jgi:membrane associated rhomboid family serine protease
MKNENNPHTTTRNPLIIPAIYGLALLGTGIGLIFGAILGNMLFGALIGCVVGLIMGFFQDRQSKSQNNR